MEFLCRRRSPAFVVCCFPFSFLNPTSNACQGPPVEVSTHTYTCTNTQTHTPCGGFYNFFFHFPPSCQRSAGAFSSRLLKIIIIKQRHTRAGSHTTTDAHGPCKNVRFFLLLLLPFSRFTTTHDTEWQMKRGHQHGSEETLKTNHQTNNTL